MWMDFVVILDPSVDKPESCFGVGNLGYADIVSLQGFDESLGHAVRPGACDRGKAGRQIERLGKQPCVSRCISKTIVCEMFDSMRGSCCAEAFRRTDIDRARFPSHHKD